MGGKIPWLVSLIGSLATAELLLSQRPTSKHVGPNLGTFKPYFCGCKEELRRKRFLDQINYEYTAL